MKRIKLDKIDRRILKNLQEDGRMSNVKLAEEAGISAPPCLRRVRALEEAGYIEGYYARVDPSVLGFSVVVFAEVKLNQNSETHLNEFQQKLESWPMVREVYMLAGEMDYLLKIVAKDWDDYQRFLTGQLTATSNVATVKSTMTIKQSKFASGVPIEV
jgi:DNA-binding Lrp family transcriptional regulator